MPDWTKSMQQTFEYYTVDPGTWKDMSKLDNIISCTIDRDSGAETKGSATIDIVESVGECYIRAYLITIQNGITEKFPLGTYLVQTPSSSFDGKIRTVSMDAYTPLLELKEKQPPLGYYIAKRENVMDTAYKLTRENVRAPVVKPTDPTLLFYDFVSNTDDTWLTFNTDLINYAKFNYDVDELGRILFAPIQDAASLQPVWTFNDDNSSILYSDITVDHDLYGIPNVVEIMYSDTNDYYYYRLVNDDPNSPTSTVSRGREIIYRESNPSVIGDPTEGNIREYAELTLRNLSTLEYTISYTHGYCPVRVGDCVRLNYTRAGLVDIKARVTKQSINCTSGCPVTETATFTTKLWR